MRESCGFFVSNVVVDWAALLGYSWPWAGGYPAVDIIFDDLISCDCTFITACNPVTGRLERVVRKDRDVG